MRDEHHIEPVERLLGLGHQRPVALELAQVRCALEDDIAPAHREVRRHRRQVLPRPRHQRQPRTLRRVDARDCLSNPAGRPEDEHPPSAGHPITRDQKRNRNAGSMNVANSSTCG